MSPLPGEGLRMAPLNEEEETMVGVGRRKTSSGESELGPEAMVRGSHTYTHAHTHTYACMHIHTHTRMLAHAHTHARMLAHAHTHARTCAHIQYASKKSCLYRFSVFSSVFRVVPFYRFVHRFTVPFCHFTVLSTDYRESGVH